MIEHMDIAYAPSPTPQQQQQPSNKTENNIENPLAKIPITVIYKKYIDNHIS